MDAYIDWKALGWTRDYASMIRHLSDNSSSIHAATLYNVDHHQTDMTAELVLPLTLRIKITPEEIQERVRKNSEGYDPDQLSLSTELSSSIGSRDMSPEVPELPPPRGITFNEWLKLERQEDLARERIAKEAAERVGMGGLRRREREEDLREVANTQQVAEEVVQIEYPKRMERALKIQKQPKGKPVEENEDKKGFFKGRLGRLSTKSKQFLRGATFSSGHSHATHAGSTPSSANQPQSKEVRYDNGFPTHAGSNPSKIDIFQPRIVDDGKGARTIIWPEFRNSGNGVWEKHLGHGLYTRDYETKGL